MPVGSERGSVPLELHQGSHGDAEVAEPLRAADFRQVDDETGCHHFGPELTQQVHRGRRGAAGGDEIVHEDDPVAGADGIDMDLDLVGAVFEGVGRRNRLVG